MTENPLGLAQAGIISALRSSESRLSSLPDLVAQTKLDHDLAVEALKGLIPDHVRVSKIKNNAGNVLFAPVDRAPSKRELGVTDSSKFIRVAARFYYFKIRGVSTCDL